MLVDAVGLARAYLVEGDHVRPVRARARGRWITRGGARSGGAGGDAGEEAGQSMLAVRMRGSVGMFQRMVALTPETAMRGANVMPATVVLAARRKTRGARADVDGVGLAGGQMVKSPSARAFPLMSRMAA